MFSSFHGIPAIKVFALSFTLVLTSTAQVLSQQPSPVPVEVASPPQIRETKQDDEEQVVRVYALRYLAANEAHERVHSLLGDLNLQIAVDPRTNTIVARGTEEELKTLSTVLEQLDTQPIPPPVLKTIDLEKATLRRVMSVLSSLNMNDVEIAVVGDERLIVRGDERGLAKVEEIVKLAAPPVESQPQELTVEVLWLTESPVPDADPFVNEIAQKLQQRGFGGLKVLSQLEVSTVEGMRCEAQGAARIGNLECEFSTQPQQGRIGLEVQLQATYATDEGNETRAQGQRPSMDQLRFRTSVNTAIDRWIVFGVAQRAGATGQQRGRDLFLIRIRKQEPL